MKRVGAILLILALAGCGGGTPGFIDRILPGRDAAPEAGQDASAETAEAGQPLTAPMRETVPPPPDATTAEEFDTTTEAERVAAAEPVGGGRMLGTTIASLGEIAQPGFWMETPLVTEVTQGRVVYPVNGKSVQVELRPSGGAAGSGSRISLGAMRVLEADLSSLPELQVFTL